MDLPHCYFNCCHFSCVDGEFFRQFLFQMISVNTAKKHTFFPMFFNLSMYVFLCFFLLSIIADRPYCARWLPSTSLCSFIYSCSTFLKCTSVGLVAPSFFYSFVLFVTIISVPVHSFLVLRVDNMLLHAVILLAMF